MKKILVFSLFSIALFAIIFTKSDVAKKTLPGYYEQWLEMKTMGTGIVPQNLQSLWNKWGNNVRRTDELLTNFEEVGPFNVGGRIRAILIDRADTSHYLAAGISGGLWTSYNSGVSWKPINEHEVTLNVSCISQSESNPAIIYYGTGEGSGNSVGLGGNGVFKSIDTGKSFTIIPSTDNANFNTCWKIAVHPKNEQIVYVATDNKGLYRTKDGGTTWEKVLNVTQEINDLDLMENGKIFASIKSAGIFVSDSGNIGTFSKIVSPTFISSSFARIELGFCKKFRGVMYAAFSSPDNGYNGFIAGVYKSSDTGKTWKTIATPTTNAVGAGFTWYCKILEVSPVDSNFIFFGAVSPGYSPNGGLGWIAADNTHADYHSVCFNHLDPRKFLVGNDGGAHRYFTNRMSNAQTLNNGLNITQFYHGSYHPSSKDYAGGTQDNGTQLSFGQNKIFQRILGADGAFTHFHQQLPGVIYGSFQNGILHRVEYTEFSVNTTRILNELDADDDGNIDESVRFINPYFMNYLDGDQLFFVTNSGIWRSKSGGNSWVKITGNAASLYAIGLSAHTNPVLYAGGNGTLVRIENAGNINPGNNQVYFQNRVPGITGNFVSCIKVNPHKHDRIYVSFSNFSNSSRLLMIDSALSNSPKVISLGDNLPSNLPINWFDIDPTKPDSVFIVGTDYGLYTTIDGGISWKKDLRVPNVSVNAVYIRPDDRRVFIYTHGRGCFTGILPGTPNVGISKVADINWSLFPNPSNNFINIKIDNALSPKYEIYGLKGDLVAQGNLAANGNIAIKNLEIGTYIIKIYDADKFKTFRFLKSN